MRQKRRAHQEETHLQNDFRAHRSPKTGYTAADIEAGLQAIGGQVKPISSPTVILWTMWTN
jgi:hypothetical protein